MSDTGMSTLKRALLAVEELQARVRALEGRASEPIAIIGSACRFPGGASTPEAFADFLRSGGVAQMTEPPVRRPGWPQSDSGETLPPAAYLTEDVGAFDPGFFGISPREATSIDPQQRLVLECAWEALERAAIDPRGLEGSRTGVFVGVAGNDYAQLQLGSPRSNELVNTHFASGVGHSMASGRISYLLGLQGPSLTVDTACSSSLVAVHLAVQALRASECDLAIAAGVNLILTTDFTRAFHRSGMLSRDGRCRTFDAAAGGFGRGEGCGVIAVKRLSDAIRDGDPVLAILRAAAVNQDGPSTGLTAPNGPAQEAVVRGALAQAGLKPDDIGYIETHGTATELGDPIEVQALGSVFRSRGDDDPLLIGSVKTNVGHLEAAAGMAGLFKAIEVVRSGVVPKHLHFDEPSPHIPWNTLPLRVTNESSPLERSGSARRVGVSSFGFSGTNAHVIVEEPPPGSASVDSEASTDWGVEVLTISSPTEAGRRETARRWAESLGSTTDRWAEICHTASAGRPHFPHRLAVSAGDASEARERLRSWLDTGTALGTETGHPVGEPGRMGFLFTGQGSQHEGMGWGLMGRSDAYRRTVYRCAEALEGVLDVGLIDVMNPAGSEAPRIHETALTQPALYALQCGLVEMWKEWGVKPDLVLGHSIGEFAAAYCSGVFDLEDGARLVAARGRAMAGSAGRGRMSAVRTGEDRVVAWIDRVGAGVSLAAVNAPDQVVVSGTLEGVEAVESLAREAGVEVKGLKTSNAFHSESMREAAEEFGAVVRGIELRPADRVRFVSTVTGAPASPDLLTDPNYWTDQILSPVRFADAVGAVVESIERTLEIGPHPTLSTLVQRADHDVVTHATLRSDREPEAQVRATLHSLYLEGIEVDWPAVHRGRARASVPTSTFVRTSLWVDLGAADVNPVPAPGHPLLGCERVQPGPERVFEQILSADSPAYVGDHVVLGRVLLPGTCFIEMLLSAARQVLGPESAVEDIDLIEAMDLGGESRRVQLRLSPTLVEGEELWDAAIHSAPAKSAPGDPWILHARAHVRRAAHSAQDIGTSDRSDVGIGPAEPAATFYGSFADRGYAFGPLLRTVVEVDAEDGEARGEVRVPVDAEDDAYRVHPLLLDGALQVVSAALGPAGETTFLPVAVERVEVHGDPGSRARVNVTVLRNDERAVLADVEIRGLLGRAVLGGVLFRPISDAKPGGTEAPPLLEVRWVETGRMDDGSTGARPTLSDLVGVLDSELVAASHRFGIGKYDAFTSELEARSAAFAARALLDLGWSAEPGDEVDEVDLAHRFEIVPSRRRLFGRVLRMLEEDEVLIPIGAGRWSVVSDLDALAADGPIDGSVSDNPGPPAVPAPEAVLLERCGPHLAENLRGIGDPLELLFPGGDASDAERMYHEAPMARVLNHAVAELIGELASGHDARRPLRILEVGGGTGGTTVRVLDRLATDETESVAYTFTDVGPAFVARARDRWGDLPAFEARTFDLDRTPASQGFGQDAAFDVVIAANCLHAARRLEPALANVRALLAPDGVLIAPEVFLPHRWFDLTVGLIDGWWHFEDTELRPEYACIEPNTWMEVLDRSGFEGAAAIPVASVVTELEPGLASSGQGLVVAAVPAARGAESSGRSSAPWLIVSPPMPLRDAVVAALSERGVQATTADTSEGGVASLDRAMIERDRWAGALLLSPARGPKAVASRLRAELDGLLAIAGSAVGGSVSLDRGIRIVTRGACVADVHDSDPDPVGAAAWGFGRSIDREAPELPCVRLDLDAVPAASDGAHIARWLMDDDSPRECAFRRGRVLTPRLDDRSEESDDDIPLEYELVHDGSGSMEGLHLVETPTRAPEAGEVEIRVAATGLNFRDVLNTLGMYPGDAGPLGAECAGVVHRVGSGVDHVRPGDRVLTAHGGAFRRHVRAQANMVVPLPHGVPFAMGATFAVPYLTAYFALHHLGRLGPDDTVLIHAATGGVGSAARALARRAGATVLATAGTDQKREMLRDSGLVHVFDSRSDAFVQGVLDATDGRGATVVLNSLADDLVDATFAATAAGGRFLEIGKRGIWSEERVAALEKGIEYHVIDWGRTLASHPETVGRLFREVVGLWEADEIAPLPVETFTLDRAGDAFRLMARGGHTGKIAVLHPVQRTAKPVEIEPDASYLVTGGTSGLGLVTARWLADRGARSLVLISRSGPDPETMSALAELRSRDVRVEVREADVANSSAVNAVVHEIRAEMAPLRGVIHAAGVLSNNMLSAMEWADVESVSRAKALGSMVLADATRDDDLAFFVGYSSIASIMGSAGQANHAAANAFLDTFAASLWGRVDRAMSIAWGPWGETGSAAREEVLRRTGSMGLGALTTSEGVAQLDEAFRRPAPLVVAMKVDRAEALLERGDRSLLARLVERAPAAGKVTENARVSDVPSSFVERLESLPASARKSHLRRTVQERIRTVLGLAPDADVEPRTALGDLGLDSLLAVELRNALGTVIEQKLPASLIFDHPTVEALTDHLGERLGLEKRTSETKMKSGSTSTNDTTGPVGLDLVDSLSDEDVDRLLAERMGRND